jgi:hypothetical protein
VPLSFETEPAIAEPAPLIERRSSARRDDVILPRTAVVLWSFLALLAVVLAFCTGLFIGHFVWSRGIPVNLPAVERATDRG